MIFSRVCFAGLLTIMFLSFATTTQAQRPAESVVDLPEESPLETQERLLCERKFQSLNTYITRTEEIIRSHFENRNRYRYAIKRRLERLIRDRQRDFMQDCPNFVPNEEVVEPTQPEVPIQPEVPVQPEMPTQPEVPVEPAQLSRCESARAGYANYEELLQNQIREAFANRSRYRYAIKRRLEKLLRRRAAEVAHLCNSEGL